MRTMHIGCNRLPTFLLVWCLVAGVHQSALGQNRSLLVIVDMEPDDRIALLLLAAEFPDDIAFVGTTGMHAGRKQVLAKQFLDQAGLSDIPVIQGSGGEASTYPKVASSAAALEYQSEGYGLLPDYELERINREMPRSSDHLSLAIQDLLRTRDQVEIVLLAPATDLILALDAEPALSGSIKRIYIMGGWTESVLSSGEIQLFTTYNWNMSPSAAAALMSMEGIPMVLYSSHVIKSIFPGGSINRVGFPAIIGELDYQRLLVPAFHSFLVAANSWDQHVMAEIPILKTVIGVHAGHQFTPADPAVVIGIIRSDFVISTRPVVITIDPQDFRAKNGFNVTVKTDADSEIILVEELDIEVFREQVVFDLQQIAGATAQRSEN